MGFFSSSIGVLQTLVTALGAGLAAWGVVNLLEGYGNDTVGECHTAESINSLTVQVTLILIQSVIVLIIQKTGEKGKCPVTEYFHKPLIGFSIFFLKKYNTVSVDCGMISLVMYCTDYNNEVKRSDRL